MTAKSWENEDIIRRGYKGVISTSCNESAELKIENKSQTFPPEGEIFVINKQREWTTKFKFCLGKTKLTVTFIQIIWSKTWPIAIEEITKYFLDKFIIH